MAEICCSRFPDEMNRQMHTLPFFEFSKTNSCL